MKASIASFAAFALVLAACSGSTEYVPPEDDATDSTSAELSLCKPAKCGPALGMPAILCEDGSIGGNTGRCIRKKGVCGWEIRPCPPPPPPPPPKPDCSAKDACGPAPLCGVMCGTCVDVGGTCGWKCAPCPPPPPPPGEKCGEGYCSAKQTCCDGMPFTKPTCIDGTICPISQRKHKKDISYLSSTDEQRLNDELLGIPLATYRYKSETATDREHLGFIIDDIAPSPAVTASGERVDMYGYQTMTVAALKVQAREIAELRRQLEELKAQRKR